MQNNKNHFTTIGNLGMASRLRRFSDYLMGEVKDIYKKRGIDFDPVWFPLFTLLLREDKIGIMQASEALGYTHPYIIRIAGQLEKKKLIVSKRSTTDARARELQITPAGKKLADKLKPVWDSIQRCVEKTVQEIGVDITKTLEKAEIYFGANPFSEQVDRLDAVEKFTGVKVIRYNDKLKWEFERLNRQWIEKYFLIEPVDTEVFSDPDGKIIKNGGEIIFALLGNSVVGTCALIREGSRYQLGRMAVDEQFQGHGIGTILMEEMLKIARRKKAQGLYLHSNTRLRPAIRLYEKFGFTIAHEGQHPKFIRGNLIMEKNDL